MPFSSDENREYVLDIVSNIICPDSILDVGAGSGTYSDLLRKTIDPMRFDAIEVWDPYIRQFDLTKKYDHVYQVDVREFHLFRYDLVIFGDVLEHMSLEQAKDVWGRAAQQAAWGMISSPIVHYPQGAMFDNPFEVHVQDHLTADQIVQEKLTRSLAADANYTPALLAQAIASPIDTDAGELDLKQHEY